MIDIPENTEALIFDLDGTLADTMPLHCKAWSRAGEIYNVEINSHMIQAMAGIPTIQSVVKLNESYDWDLDPVEFKVQKDRIYNELKATEGSPEAILPILSIARNYYGKLPLAVGTGSARLTALATLRDLQIIDMFVAIVSANDVERPKPFPDTFLECAYAMNVSPSKCFVFEDGDIGIQAAINAGMKCVDVRNHL